MQIQDENGKELPQGDVGTVYFEAPATGRFEYFKAPEKTAGVYRGAFYTMGDLGYVDEDGFLFLTGRSAEVIILVSVFADFSGSTAAFSLGTGFETKRAARIPTS